MPDYTAGKAKILLEPIARNFYNNARAAIRASVANKPLHADVRLRPVGDGFATEADKKIKATHDLVKRVELKPILAPTFRTSVRDQVNAATQNLHLSVQLSATVDFTRANAQILAWRRRQEAVPLRIHVSPQQGGITGVTTGAGSRNWRARNIPGSAGAGPQGGNFVATPQINSRQFQAQMIAVMKSAVQQANGPSAPKINPQINGNIGSNAQLKRQMANLQRDFQENFRLRIQPTFAGVQLRLPLGSLGTQVIPAAVAGIASLIASLHQLSQAGLAVPGGLAVAGASIGTFALGLAGIGDAWKALSAEQDRSAEQATTDAARMAQAYDSVRNASVDVTRAQKDLNDARKDARRDLEDLHREERSNNLSVAEAALNLREARNELAKGGFKGTLDRDRAVLRELQAQESLSVALERQKRTKEDVTEADKKGVNGSDAVVSAQENLTRSTQALTAATTQLRIESSGAANAADKVKAAMENLGPETAKVVETVWGMKPAFQDLRRTVAGNMFKDFSQNIEVLANTSMPLLQRRLGGMGTVWNETLKQMTSTLGTSSTQSIFDRIFGNTEETQRRLNRSIDPIIRGMGTLAAAGSDAMPRLALGIEDVTNKFANWVQASDDNGRLDKMINSGIDGFTTLGRIISNVGTSVSGIGKAFGGGFLNMLENLTKKLSNFLNSARGQEDLRIFINNVKTDFEAWRPILQDLAPIFGTAMEAARQAIQAVLPIINIFTEVLEHSPALVTAVATAFLGWSAIRPIISGVEVGVGLMSTALVGLGTGFDGAKKKGADAAKEIDTAFGKVGKAGSGVSNAAQKLAMVGSVLGPYGAIVGGVAVTITALLSLMDTHDDAADAADRQRRSTDRLADSLERVSKAAGAATIAAVVDEMADFQPDASAGLKGNVLDATSKLGIDANAFAASVLPGGSAARGGFLEQFKAKVQPTVEAELKRMGLDLDPARVTSAFLGNQDDVKWFTSEISRLSSISEAEGNGAITYDLGNVADAIQRAGGTTAAAGLAGQFLNSRAPQVTSAQDLETQKQQATTGKLPTLSPNGAAFFKGVQVTKIGFDGDVVGAQVVGLSDPAAKNLEDRNNQVSNPYRSGFGENTRDITFSEADSRELFSYAAGGPTPSGKGRGPSGGHIVEVHDDEWVLPKHARHAIGDERLWQLTGNRNLPRRRGFDLGGPGNLPVPLAPPIIPPVDPVAPAIPDIVAPAIAPPTPAVPQAGLPDPNAHGTSTPGVGPLPGPPELQNAAPGVTAAPMDPSDPAYGSQYAPGADGQPTDLGGQFLNAWFPWLGTVQSAMKGGEGAAQLGLGDSSYDPLSYVAEWGGNFISNFANTLFGGVLGFFGMSPDNAYFNAIKQVTGFYGDKFGPMLAGGGADQYVDGATQDTFNQGVDSYANYPQQVQLSDGSIVSIAPPAGVAGSQLLASTATVGDPFEGSGVIAAGSPGDQAKIDASRAPNAQVIPDANIIAYIRQQAEAFGLTMGDEGKAGGDPYRTSESASLHTIGMAGDIFGAPEDRRKFLEAWHTDPILRNATRMIIDDNNTDLEMYAGQNSGGGIYGRGQHGDHIHLGLEGVPGFADPNTGQIYQRNIGGTSVVSGSNNGTAAPANVTEDRTDYGWFPKPGGTTAAPTGSEQRTDRAPLGSFFTSGGAYSGGGSGGSSGMPPLDYGNNAAGAPQAPGRTPLDKKQFPFLFPTSPNAGKKPTLFPGPFGPGGVRRGRGPLTGQGRVVMPGQMGGKITPGIAPKGDYAGGNQQVWDSVYKAFIEAGFDPAEWPATIKLLNGESGWRPTVANPSSGAFGLFQFLGSTQKAYLPDKNPDPYIQGRAGMRYIKDRYGSPAKAWQFWQNQSPHWYDRSGMLPRGLSVVANQKDEEEVIMGKRDAQKAKKIIDNARQMDPRMGIGGSAGEGVQMAPDQIPATTKRPGPPLTPDVDIPKAVATPGISAPASQLPKRYMPGAAPESHDYVLPALAKGIQSGAGTLGGLASMAISAAAAGGTMGASSAAGGMGAGQAGQMISGLFQQGGKIATGVANVFSAMLTGITKGGTTENPYGVTLKNNQQAPPLAQDNRRVHNGDNNFASMDEWRRQTQIQDAQDMQTQLARR